MQYLSKLSLLFFAVFFLASATEIENTIGDKIDELNSVPIYYNGPDLGATFGRNTTEDGYNLGLKYQCVEFVKRYYYEVYGHKMPNSYGNAKDFFDPSLADDVAFNPRRGLYQYKNVRYSKPQVGDILVYNSFGNNPYGHVGIIGEVAKDHIILYQQNFKKKTRQKIKLVEFSGIYTVADYDILGWLRYQ